MTTVTIPLEEFEGMRDKAAQLDKVLHMPGKYFVCYTDYETKVFIPTEQELAVILAKKIAEQDKSIQDLRLQIADYRDKSLRKG